MARLLQKTWGEFPHLPLRSPTFPGWGHVRARSGQSVDPSIVANAIVEIVEVKARLSTMERAEGESTPSIVRDPLK